MSSGEASPAGLSARAGRLVSCREVRGGCTEWDIELDGEPARAVAYASLLPQPLRPGDRVLLNTTAVDLALGTGGVHFVVAVLPEAGEAPPAAAPFPGRAAGHILKLRYTPLQHRVLAVEEEASPHHAAIRAFTSLRVLPVVAAELLSQACAAAIVARTVAPEASIAFLQLDSAALPLPFSRLVTHLREKGVFAATITCGQAFGGDYEAINAYTGLICAVEVVAADLVIVSQGPGNAGSGTPYGFSGLALVEALHAAATLGGEPILVPRVSSADPRERHQGLSHHTRTLLHCLRVPVTLPAPAELLPHLSPHAQGHALTACETEEGMGQLREYSSLLTTMGRTLDQDPLFFRAAAAAGRFAALRVRERRGSG